MKKLQNNSRGFTIIEVLIVLAIAGLILLIVFLAVPALQRNSRNTQRKNDVQNALGGVTEYTNNHNGSLPPDETAIISNIKLAYYTDTDFEFTNSIPSPVDQNKLVIVTGAKCNDDGTATTSGASSRNFVALYSVETSGDLINKCQQS